MGTPFEQILKITLTNVQKLLIDHRTAPDYAAADEVEYKDSQFRTIYDNQSFASPPDPDADPTSAYEVPDPLVDTPNEWRRTFKGDTPEPGDMSGFFYPLTMQETLDLQSVRILDCIQLGFVPIDDLEKYEAPALFIANATDRQRIEPADTTLNQVQEVIPLNFRLMTKQPDDYSISTTNIVVVDKVLEGLKYVLNRDDYINLTFERRGYDQDTVIRSIDFVQALNLEEFLSPYEVVDYLFQITVREQWSRSC